MTRDEQKQFVINLCESIRTDVEMAILNEWIPAEWDGHELRELLAAKFNDARGNILKDKKSKRYREYANTCLINNL